MSVSREGARGRAYLCVLIRQIFDMTSVLYIWNVSLDLVSACPNTSKNLNALYLKSELTFLEVCEGAGRPVWFLIPLSSPSLSSKLHSAQRGSAGLMRAMWRVLEQMQVLQRHQKTLCRQGGSWRTWSAGCNNFGAEEISELKIHMLCCLRAFWLLNECKTSFMQNSVEA